MVSWAHFSLQPKQHLDRFISFSAARGYVQQTDRQTDAHTRTQTTNVGNNRSPNKVNAEDNLQESVDSECLAGRKRQARK